jgi:hypothetical protein
MAGKRQKERSPHRGKESTGKKRSANKPKEFPSKKKKSPGKDKRSANRVKKYGKKGKESSKRSERAASREKSTRVVDSKGKASTKSREVKVNNGENLAPALINDIASTAVMCEPSDAESTESLSP